MANEKRRLLCQGETAQPETSSTSSVAQAADILHALACGKPRCPCVASARRGKGQTHCPAHSDGDPSLSVKDSGGKPLVKCFGGCTQEAVIEALRERGLWPRKATRIEEKPATRGEPQAIYDYRDGEGQLVYQVLRYPNKDFLQRRPDGKGGWVWDLAGVQRLLYCLPELRAADPASVVYVAEGEKDIDALRLQGLVATCNSGGSGRWQPELNQPLAGRHVILLPDNDSPGRAHAQDVAAKLYGIAASIKIVELEGLPDKGDVSDWLAQGRTVQELEALALSTPEWTPAIHLSDDDGDGGDGDRPNRKKSQATRLVELMDTAELFHGGDGKPYATLDVGGHRETHPLRSKGFRDLLAARYFHQEGVAPNVPAINDALGVLAGRAVFQGPEYPVFVRVAHVNGEAWLDLCNESWEAVRVTTLGWDVEGSPSPRFIRRRGMLPLPVPQAGNLEALAPFLNTRTHEDAVLLVAWLLGTLGPRPPYPILVLTGEQGSGKSYTISLLRRLVDPNLADLRAEPREIRDLVIAGNGSWLVALDNLSRLPEWLSDGLCRLSTGAGFSTRELYSDEDETIFSLARPVAINSITELARRGDLLDRSIIVDLPPIGPERRRAEASLEQDLAAQWPHLLGGILDAVATGLMRLPTVTIAERTRMADFQEWIEACAPALGLEDGEFSDLYSRNRMGSNEAALEGSLVAPLLPHLPNRWQGGAAQLLDWLNRTADDATQRHRDWPKDAARLGNILRRIAPNLRGTGIEISFDRAPHTRKRIIEIAKLPSPPSPTVPQARNERKVGDSRGTAGTVTLQPTVPMKTPILGTETLVGDGGDGGDSKLASPIRGQVRSLAESKDWPKVELSQGVYVGPGRESWEKFLAWAKPDKLALALSALGGGGYLITAVLQAGAKVVSEAAESWREEL